MAETTLDLYHIRVRREGAVGYIVMDRPERFNALDVPMARDLRKAALHLARDRGIRCVVLAGTDRVFCSGADLKYVREREHAEDFSYLQPEGQAEEGGYGRSFKEILEYLHSTISEIRRAPKPFIAAVKGIAAAGGFGLAMCCDLVYASDRAAFEWAYSKTGLTGAESITFILPRLVGLRRTLEMAFLNPRLSAQEALDLGLVTAVFPFETFDQDVDAVAQQLAKGPTKTWGLTKQLVNEALDMDRLDVHLTKELRALVESAETRDFAEGLEAFFAKRSPEFRGE
jgi:2-(1,2-epoxy-1,2-dihydrophenyl)acetyl-CoA isomerase